MTENQPSVSRAVLFCFLFQLVCTGNIPAQGRSAYLTGEAIEGMLSDPAKRNFDLTSWSYSFIGDYRRALENFDKRNREDFVDAAVAPDSLRTFTFKPAKEFLVERSRAHQIVIINEAHHQPLHRVFTESLLEDLYRVGFRYLGLEGLAEDSLINIRKWPLVQDGYYTREPQFGNMVREALRLGFRVFGYEAPGKRGAEREKGQAANIARIFAGDPGARILIHCGFGHVKEGRSPAGGKMMAGELKAITNKDPLTIDQVDLTERSSPEFEAPVFRNHSVAVSSVLLDEKGRVSGESNPGSRVDIQVIHPRTQYINGRPGWLLRNNAWKPLEPGRVSASLAAPYLVSAYLRDEAGTDSVPVDQIEVHSGGQFGGRPPGEFQGEISDRKGNV